ncbi:hypothetical protein RJ55_05748 [Drechmeria coniospora]|nr:hypothetical protein RJ55_05748 [Drechmeria coniospora]
MRFVDLAIDVAALLNASRSVASKHIALRTRQLDVYSKTSSISATSAAKNGKDKVTEENLATARGNGIHDHAAAKPGTSASRCEPSEGETPHTVPASFSTAQEQAMKAEGDLAAELDLPPGIDVNIFHTARGSKILESVRKQKATTIVGPQQPRVVSSAKEHPLRHWPVKRPVDINATHGSTANHSEGRDKASPPRPATSGLAQAMERQPQHVSAAQVCSKKVDVDSNDTVAEHGGQATSTRAYRLRESKVPASRMSRMWNYGGLAAGILGGAMTEGITRAFGGGGKGSVLLSERNMERLVAKLSRMRGAALKLGQMMSFQDTKMLPAPIQEVLQRVQDRADYMPAWQRDKVLVGNLGENWRDLFSEFEEKPIAAASIGQVHKAVLKSNGKRVAVKVQFPGVADSINSDLDNLGILLNATSLLPKGLYLNKTIDNARLELGWECDYEREAECAIRYKELLRGEEDVFLAPDVHLEACGKQVLTMDFLDGVGVTRVKSFTQHQRDWIGTQLMRLCLREITEFKFMQTDPNWTNFLYNADDNKLELLDFGASRDYPETFVRQYVQLLEAASRADRVAVGHLSESLGYLTGHESKAMFDAHVDSVLTIAEPFLASAPEVYDFKDQTITERVKALIPLMLHERLAPPPEETYSLHRKLSGAFLLCARLGSKVPCRQLFVDAVARSGYVGKAE